MAEQEQDSDGVWSFTYDGSGRLIRAERLPIPRHASAPSPAESWGLGSSPPAYVYHGWGTGPHAGAPPCGQHYHSTGPAASPAPA